MTSTTSVSVNFKRHEMVILGTEYAGEMKKGASLWAVIVPHKQHSLIHTHTHKIDLYSDALLDA